MLLDSNIIIYSFQPGASAIINLLKGQDAYYSHVSKVETLGYHLLSAQEKNYLEAYFSSIHPLPVTNEVVTKAIELRQKKKMSLGDSLIAATAIVFSKRLVTRNTKDFEWIEGLAIINPFNDDS